MIVETLRFQQQRLELIDQRLLPQRLEYVTCSSAAEVAGAIRAMVVRGAPAIGCAAAYGIALEGRRIRHAPPGEQKGVMEQAFATLAASRPTAVNLFWALERMRGRWTALLAEGSNHVAGELLAEAAAIHLEDAVANRRLGEHGAGLLPDGARVLTHCNAGALATAAHGTALGVVRSARDAGKRVSVIAGETRPFLQGARLTAWELMQEGIPVTLITDNMAGHLMSRGEVDAVIVGADRVAANGDVANKIGTYMLAVLAERHHLPFLVAAPLSTIDRSIACGSDIPIEERPREEVLGFRELRWAPEEVPVRNPAFDVTPAALVSALITEMGIVERPDASGISALFGGMP